MIKNTTPTVDAIGKLNFEGNVIPSSWYHNIKLPSGKTDAIAIILLADIVYWYRPTIERDENTGMIISIKRKFKADMLQKQYESWGEQFGFTKERIKEAVTRLVELNLIKREFRSITTKNGLKLTNVMFIEPIVENIETITYELTKEEEKTPRWEEKIPIGGGEKDPQVGVENTHTYTEITTKTTTDNNIYIHDIFCLWNKQKIVSHKQINEFRSTIANKLQDYSIDEIKEAITNYGKILHSEDYFWDYRWSLDQFLTRPGELDKFLNINEPFDNYKKKEVVIEDNKKTPSTPPTFLTPPSPSSLKQTPKEIDSEHIRLANLLKNLILKNNPKAKITETQIKQWAKVVYLMLERDNRTLLEIEQIIKWCQQDDFWMTNILSMDKLRKQFDRLWMRKNHPPKRKQFEPQPQMADREIDTNSEEYKAFVARMKKNS